MRNRWSALLTSWTPEEKDADTLLETYRERGTAEGHFGELMSVLHPALSSVARPKTHYQGKTPKKLVPTMREAVAAVRAGKVCVVDVRVAPGYSAGATAAIMQRTSG